jgi:hypothetical protein
VRGADRLIHVGRRREPDATQGPSGVWAVNVEHGARARAPDPADQVVAAGQLRGNLRCEHASLGC